MSGTNIIGPQKPAIKITRSTTLLNRNAINIAKLPIMILVILATINILP